MVKGVNKSIIEINETGSKFFNKAILFVAPEYVDKDGKRMSREVSRIIKKMTLGERGTSLRAAVLLKRKRKRAALICIAAAVAIIAAVIIIL